jgi:hypothetical protein
VPCAFAISRDLLKEEYVSRQVFPTRTNEGEWTLLEKTVPALCGLGPDFCSVTSGAGGRTRARTHPFVERLIGTTRREFLDEVLFWNACDLEGKVAEFKGLQCGTLPRVIGGSHTDNRIAHGRS